MHTIHGEAMEGDYSTRGIDNSVLHSGWLRLEYAVDGTTGAVVEHRQDLCVSREAQQHLMSTEYW